MSDPGSCYFGQVTPNSEGAEYPPLHNKFRFEATLADEYMRDDRGGGYYIHAVSIVGDFQDCSAHVLCAALHAEGYPLSYEVSQTSVHVIAKRFDIDAAAIENASLLKVEVVRSVECIEGAVGHDPRFHQALIRSIVNSMLSLDDCVSFKTSSQDAGGVVAVLTRDSGEKAKASVDAVVYSFKGITAAGQGKVLISFEVDNFEIFDYGLTACLRADDGAEEMSAVSIVDNASVFIIGSSEGFLTKADKLNLARGYNTYLPANRAQSSIYWGLRAGCVAATDAKHFQVQLTDGGQAPIIMPSNLLARSIQERNGRTRNYGTYQAQSLLSRINKSTSAGHFSSISPPILATPSNVRDRILGKRRRA